MHNDHSVSAHWHGEFDEPRFRDWAERTRRQLKAARVDLGLVFMSPEFFPVAPQVLEILRVHAQVPLLVGCSSGSLIAGAREIEDDTGLVLGLYFLPGVRLDAVHFSQEQVEESDGPAYWHRENGVLPEETNGWLCFADPYRLDCERWLRGWNEAYAPLPILGGLASGRGEAPETQVYLNGDVFDSGGVAVSIGGDVSLASVISQGCTPIGESWTITRVDKNVILEIANRPAFDVLSETVENLSEAERATAPGNLFVGLVVNEYLEEFGRGDFLIRNLLGADPSSGAIAIGAYPRPGQTMQFQRRSAATGTEDIEQLLGRTKRELAGRPLYGGCLCSCNGRGQRLFGEPHHDARQVQEHLGPFGLAGFFCNGEVGPVGRKNFLHGYTASLALFVRKQAVQN